MLTLLIVAGVASSASSSARGIECEVLDALFIQQAATGAQPTPGAIGRLASPSYSAALVAQVIPTLAASVDVPDKGVAARASHSLAWKPDCSWSTPPTGLVNTFSRPIVTKDRRLAAFQWDTGLDDPPRDLGKVCLAYKPAKTWRISCTVTRER
jgi:hypothetical protein